MPQLYPGRRHTRAKAPLQILRGYYPNEPGHLSVTATPKLGAGILQGMAITLNNDGEWIKAKIVAVAGVGGWPDAKGLSTSVFIARQDQEDPAVQSSGKLTGLDCSGTFEVQTGYVVAGTFARDVEVTIADGTGEFKLAVTGDHVVGRVSAVGAGVGGLIAYSGLTPPTATLAAADRLQFKTVANYTKKATDI